MKTGFHKNIDEEIYHKGPEFSSHRLIDAYFMTENKYHMKYVSKILKGPFPEAFTFGSAYHMSILEPDRFMDDVLEQGDLRKPTSAQLNAKNPSPATIKQIADWNLFKMQSKDKIVLTQSEYSKILDMREALMDHDKARELIECDGETELSGYCTFNDEPCRIRIDKFIRNYKGEGPLIVDLKTSFSANLTEFYNKCFNMRYGWGYQMQAAFYKMIVKDIIYKTEGVIVEPKFAWIFQEVNEPYDIGVYEAGESLISEGMRMCYQAWDRMMKIEEEGPTIQGYTGDKIQIIESKNAPVKKVTEMVERF